jgi:hypothetical protein
MQSNKSLKNTVKSLKRKHVIVTYMVSYIESNLIEFLLNNSVKVSVLDN